MPTAVREREIHPLCRGIISDRSLNPASLPVHVPFSKRSLDRIVSSVYWSEKQTHPSQVTQQSHLVFEVSTAHSIEHWMEGNLSRTFIYHPSLIRMKCVSYHVLLSKSCDPTFFSSKKIETTIKLSLSHSRAEHTPRGFVYSLLNHHRTWRLTNDVW